VQIPRARFHQVRQVRSHEDVQRQALARLAVERETQFAHDLAAGAVAAEEVAGLDAVGAVEEGVVHGGDYDVGGGAREGDEGGVEAEGPAGVDGAAGEDGLEEGLREVDVVAGACGFVGALAG